MIIVADGGSTKVDWCIIQGVGSYKRIHTKGQNPFFRTKEEIIEEIKSVIFPETEGGRIEAVHFFGAGCINVEKSELIRQAITVGFNISPDIIEVGSDLFGAGKALCGHKPGIACILGTGSNSGYYDGDQVVENISPLGFILGDEGSGAVLGKLFIGACLKNQFSKEIKDAFLEEYHLTVCDIIERVYRGSLPNRFLASFTPFIKKNLSDPKVRQLVATSFEDFFRKNVMQYDSYKGLPISFTGSIAFHFQEVLFEVVNALGLKIDKVIPSPMEGLISYYENMLTDN